MARTFPLKCIATGLLLGACTGAVAGNLLLKQLQFTATEYLIYTDQLAKLEGSACRTLPLASHDVSQAQKRVLAELQPEDRESFRQLFQSEMLKQLLDENTRGLAALLDGAPAMRDQLDPKLRQTCAEFALIFQQNLAEAEQDLNALLEQYREQ